VKRSDYINLRVSPEEKRRIADAAGRIDMTVADYVRASATERMTMEQLADRLLAILLAALNDQSERLGSDLNNIAQRVGATASRDDLKKLSEWIAGRLPIQHERAT